MELINLRAYTSVLQVTDVNFSLGFFTAEAKGELERRKAWITGFIGQS